MIKKMTITTKILIVMGIGLALGSILNSFASENDFVQIYLISGLFHVVGTMFINALKMLVVPLVTFSLICGVCGIGDVGMLGRVGFKSFLLYMLTTAMAISVALTIAILIEPGKGHYRIKIFTVRHQFKRKKKIHLRTSNLIQSFHFFR